MADTPLSPGDTSSPRDNEVRWVEPVFVESAPVTPREPTRRHEADWAEFSTSATEQDGEPPAWSVTRLPPEPGSLEAETTTAAWHVELEMPAIAYGTTPGSLFIVDDVEPPAAFVEAEYAEAEWDAPALDQSALDQPISDRPAWDEPTMIEPTTTLLLDQDETDELDIRRPNPVRPVSVWRRSIQRVQQIITASSPRLARVGMLVCLVTGIGAMSYSGGDHVAGLAGAMTPPQTTQTDTREAETIRPDAPPEPRPVPVVDQAAATAASYLERAKSGDTAAQYNVAVLYARGEGLIQDFTSAAAWFAKAADAGSASAQFNLGVMYQRGLGVRQDNAEALRWYRRAADRHYAPAEYNLGVAYAEGQGTPPDPVAAARWYHQAAAQGLVPAMINFAILYEKGEGVERSAVEAYAWYRAAAQRGDSVAEKRAGELMGQFDANAKRQAQVQAVTIAGGIRQAPLEMTPLPGAITDEVEASPVAVFVSPALRSAND